MRKPFVFGLLWLTDGPGVGETAKILVQVFPDNVQILLREPPTPFVYEFELRGIGVF